MGYKTRINTFIEMEYVTKAMRLKEEFEQLVNVKLSSSAWFAKLIRLGIIEIEKQIEEKKQKIKETK